MSDYLLHLLWPVDSGMHVWVEKTQGHSVVADFSELPAGTFPAEIMSALTRQGRRMRANHSVQATLCTPKGRVKALTIPSVEFIPDSAVDFLIQLAQLEDAGTSRGNNSYAGAPSPDALFFIHLVRGIDQFVGAGRVLFRLVWEADSWFPRWQPSEGLEERGWLASMGQQIPGVLRANGGDDLVDRVSVPITDRLVRRRLATFDLNEHGENQLIKALLEGTDLPKVSAGMVTDINSWRRSLNSNAVDVIFQIIEPDSTEEEEPLYDESDRVIHARIEADAPLPDGAPVYGLPADSPAARAYQDSRGIHSDQADGGPAGVVGLSGHGNGQGHAHEVELAHSSLRWRLQLAYRSGTGAPTPIPAHITDRVLYTRISDQLARAAISWPQLNDYEADVAAGQRLLTAQQVLDFIDNGAPALRSAGFKVLVPSSWARQKVKVSIAAQPAVATGPGDARLGLDQLVNFTWSGTIGGVELSSEEISALLESGNELVKVRDEWIQADTSALRAASEHLTEFIRHSATHAGSSSESAGLTGSATVGQLRASADAMVEQLRAEGATGEILSSPAHIRGEEVEDPHNADDEPEIVVEAASWIGSLVGTNEALVPRRVEQPRGITVELREYQRRGLDWLVWMSSQRLGCVLADDMGLGKTLQTLALICFDKELEDEAEAELTETRDSDFDPVDKSADNSVDKSEDSRAVDRSQIQPYSRGNTLVIAPTAVIGNWEREAKKFAPHLRVHVHHGPSRLAGDELKEKIADADVIITTYAVLTRDIETFEECEFHRLVVDEAQNIKNPGTKNAKNVRRVNAQHRLALTGTPVENRLDELWAVMDLCNPGLFGKRNQFRDRFSIPIERHDDPDITADLKAKTQPFILRRVKTDPTIIDDLPEKSEVVLVAELTADQASLYQALTRRIADELKQSSSSSARTGAVFRLLTGLKQICNHPANYLHDDSPFMDKGKHRSGKMVVVEPIIDEALEDDRKILIFTQYVPFGRMLQEYFSTRYGFDVPFYHGSVDRNQRERIIAEFNSEDGPPILILSLKAGGTGLNLTAASVVIHMDRWWNPAVENQATDRAFRIGQKRDVNVYKLVTKSTMEEKVNDIIEGKMKLAGAVIGAGESWITELSDDDLIELVSLSEPVRPLRTPYTNMRAKYSAGTRSHTGTRVDLDSVPPSTATPVREVENPDEGGEE